MAGRQPRCTYEEASGWTQAEGIATVTAWNARRKRHDFPPNIPRRPDVAYRDQWAGWGAFFGTGAVAPRNRRYRTYAEASAWAQSKGIKSRGEWRLWCNRADFPDDIPAVPWSHYRTEWQGLPQFLGLPMLYGTSKVEQILKHSIAQVLDLDPARITRINDGIGRTMHVDMADRGRRIVIEYDGAKWHANKDAHDGRKTTRLRDAGWTVIRVREAPLQMIDPRFDVMVDPPSFAYLPMVDTVLNHLQALIETNAIRDDGLSTKIQAALQNRIEETALHALIARTRWRPYADASVWARSQGIKSAKEWRLACKRNDFPDDIPANPWKIYSEWTSLGAFLGTGAIASKHQRYRPYADASAWAQAAGIKSVAKWRLRCKQADFPDDIPAAPWRVYKDTWTNMGAFLGTGYVATRHRRYRPYADASAWAQGAGIKSAKEWKIRSQQDDFPDDIPAHPWLTYGEDWQGFGAFLGTGRQRGGQRKISARTLYVIRLAKANETAANDPVADSGFTMPWAA